MKRVLSFNEIENENGLVKKRSSSLDLTSKKYFIEGIKVVEINMKTNLDDKQMLSISPPQPGLLDFMPWVKK